MFRQKMDGLHSLEMHIEMLIPALTYYVSIQNNQTKRFLLCENYEIMYKVIIQIKKWNASSKWSLIVHDWTARKIYADLLESCGEIGEKVGKKHKCSQSVPHFSQSIRPWIRVC